MSTECQYCKRLGMAAARRDKGGEAGRGEM